MGTNDRVASACIAVCLLLASGCATREVQVQRAVASLDQAERLLDEAAPEDYIGIKIDTGLLQEGLESYQLGPGAEVIEIADGRAYARLFQLPPFAEPYFLELAPQTERVGTNPVSGTATETTIWPAVTLLDGDKQPLASYMPRYAPDRHRYFWQVGEMFGFVNICDDKPRYAVVHGVPPLYRVANSKLQQLATHFGLIGQAMLRIQHPVGTVEVGITGREPGPNAREREGTRACTRDPLRLEEFAAELEAIKAQP